MTTVNVNEDKYSVTVTEGATTVVTVKAPGPQGPGFPDGNLGDVTSSNTGASVVVNSGAITNAKVNDSAAIAGTKISPDFGSQNITTTGNAVFGGNLTVSGTTTTIDTTTLRVEDKNIELGKVGSPTDITADGGGITLLGDTNHTFNWVNATDSWTSSEHIALPDNKKLQLGDSQDFQLFHDSNHSNIKNITGNFSILSDTILLKNAANSESFIRCQNDGVELYHANSLKLATYSGGFNLTGKLNVSGDIDVPDNSKLLIGTSDDLEIFHNGSDSKITNKTGNLLIEAKNAETGIKVIPDGSVELYHDNGKKLETVADGVDAFNRLRCLGGSASIHLNSDATGANTSTRAMFGLASGNNHFISGAGAHDVVLNTPHRFLVGHASNEIMAIFDPDGSVELYHDNVKKLETTSSGITVTGSVTTQDMNMSNLNGTSNEVDNTKGSWSIQEGADDLFIINRVSGKKYKFNLTEIS